MRKLCRSIAVGLVIVISSVARGGTVAWFYALDADKAAFEAVTGSPLRSVTAGGVTMHDYRVGPHRVVAARMGAGCARTAVTVSTVLALAPADRVLSTGPAGGLRAEAEPGTWLRAEAVVAWQKGRAEREGGISPGEGAVMAVPFRKRDWPGGGWEAAKPVKLASGEAFIASGGVGAEIAAGTEAAAVEMNAFGLMAALEGRQVKVLVLRVVSDRADEKASEDFALFVKHDDGAGGRMVAEIVKGLPVEGNEPAAHEGLRELLEGK